MKKTVTLVLVALAAAFAMANLAGCPTATVSPSPAASVK